MFHFFFFTFANSVNCGKSAFSNLRGSSMPGKQKDLKTPNHRKKGITINLRFYTVTDFKAVDKCQIVTE